MTGARAALVKGGHLEGPRAIDVLATRTRDQLGAPRLRLRTKRSSTAAGARSRRSSPRAWLGDDVCVGGALREAPFTTRRSRRAVDVGGDLSVLLP